MGSETHEIAIEVVSDDPEQVQPLLRSLGETLGDVDGAEFGLVEEPPAAGTKGAGLAVQLAGTVVASALPVTIGMVHDWLRRRRGSCKLVVELEGGARAEVTDIDSLDMTLKRLEELGFPAVE